MGIDLKKRPDAKTSLNLFLGSLFFGLFYWCMEAVRDVLIFRKGTIVEQLFYPDWMTFWMRVLVICILVLFGLFLQSRRTGLEKKAPRRGGGSPVLLSGVLSGACYWFLEAVRDTAVFHRGPLWERVFLPDPMSLWMRLLAVLIILLFSLYVQNLINERKRAEDELRAAQNRLEKLVGERTAELSLANAQLQQEVEERMRAETELLKVNRALKTLSQCNEIMVRSLDETALFDNICKTLLEAGGHRLVWIGIMDGGDRPQIEPVSIAGREPEDILFLKTEFDKRDFEKCPSGRVIHSGEPVIINNMKRIPFASTWCSKAAAKGFESMVSMPLRENDRTIGSLNILSGGVDAFDRQEIDLLQELASDISYGLSMLRTQKTIKQTHEEKDKLQAQLLHSQKMEAVGILAGGVAHDFNNMLTAIQVSADLVMMEYDQSHPARHELEEIHRIATHAADLSKQLLLFSRKHPMEFIPMSINQSVDNLRKMLKRLIGERIEIETRLAQDLWSVRGDRGTIEQVIMNLVINARDAMPKGGRLLIQTENIKLGKAEARRMPEARPGKFVRLRVEDTGHGMTPEVIQHIFEPFLSTKGPGKGTGLGLSVVYGIIKEHDGWITFKSQEGKGTAFDIYLPVLEILEEPGNKPEVSLKRLTGKGERILFVEDDEQVRENSVKGLIKNSYKVHPARNIAEAVQIFDRENGRFDLFFCDMALPDGNGLDLAETLKKKAPSLHVIVSSGYSDTRENALSRKDQGILFLKKPFALKDLLYAIQEALG